MSEEPVKEDVKEEPKAPVIPQTPEKLVADMPPQMPEAEGYNLPPETPPESSGQGMKVGLDQNTIALALKGLEVFQNLATSGAGGDTRYTRMGRLFEEMTMRAMVSNMVGMGKNQGLSNKEMIDIMDGIDDDDQ